MNYERVYSDRIELTLFTIKTYILPSFEWNFDENVRTEFKSQKLNPAYTTDFASRKITDRNYIRFHISGISNPLVPINENEYYYQYASLSTYDKETDKFKWIKIDNVLNQVIYDCSN